jgi:transcriptional antiterminator
MSTLSLRDFRMITMKQIGIIHIFNLEKDVEVILTEPAMNCDEVGSSK